MRKWNGSPQNAGYEKKKTVGREFSYPSCRVDKRRQLFIRQRQSRVEKNDSVLIPDSGSNLFSHRKQSTIYHVISSTYFPPFYHDSTFPPPAPYSMTHDTPIILRAAPSQNVIKPIQIANNGGLIAHRRVYLAVHAVSVPQPLSQVGCDAVVWMKLTD